MVHIATDILKRYIRLWVVLGIGIVCLSLFMLLAKRYDAVKQDFNQTKKKLGLYRTGVWHLEKVNLDELNGQVQRLNARFASSENLSAVIGEISALAENDGVEIKSVTPGQRLEIQDEEKSVLSVLERVPIELKLVGNYKGLANFLSELRVLRQGIVTVDQFKLDKEATSSVKLTLLLSASVYVRKTSDQNILQEQISTTISFDRQPVKNRFDSIDRDPFTKKVVGGKVESVIKLEGIIYDPAQPMILINGETKGIGGRVGDMKILEIHPDHVLFDKNGEQVQVRLQQN